MLSETSDVLGTKRAALVPPEQERICIQEPYHKRLRSFTTRSKPNVKQDILPVTDTHNSSVSDEEVNVDSSDNISSDDEPLSDDRRFLDNESTPEDDLSWGGESFSDELSFTSGISRDTGSSVEDGSMSDGEIISALDVEDEFDIESNVEDSGSIERGHVEGLEATGKKLKCVKVELDSVVRKG